VSGALALGDVEEAKRAVASRALKALRCDTVTIHQLDDSGTRPVFPPVTEGDLDRTRLEEEDEPDASRLVIELIARGEITIARTAAELGPFASRFTTAESIHAALAVPLRFATRPVGLMFVSFRKELPAADVETVTELARMFGNLAAVAIGNSKSLQALTRLSTELLQVTSSREIFDRAVKVAVKHLRPDLCNIVIQENNQLRSVNCYGWPPSTYREIVEPGGGSHAGFTISRKRPVVFRHIDRIREDRNLDGFCPPERMYREEIVSGLAVPIFQDGETQGAMLVHSRTERQFTAEDVSFLSSVANQVIIAHRSTQRFRVINAQYEAAGAIAGRTDLSDERPILKRGLV
jgi:GAF domain-containing protein